MLGIVVLAFNLRPAAVSVGPVLGETRDGLGMSGTVTGVLTSLPVLAFAVFGALAPRAARVVGLHRVTLLSLVGVVLGLGLRSAVSSIPLFLLFSLLAVAGMASANVLLPSLVKLHFPDHIGLMTALYSTSLAVGLTAASVLTVPVSEAYGGWRAASWCGRSPRGSPPSPGWHWCRRTAGNATVPTSTPRSGSARSLVPGWAGGWRSSSDSSRCRPTPSSAGSRRSTATPASPPSTAGLLLGAITGISIPLSFVVPAVAARMQNQSVLMWAMGACYLAGYVGLAVAPAGGALAWALLVGAGMSTFPLILTLIGLRSRTAPGTAALSGFTQSAGYLLAIVGPFGVGVLHDLSGGWTVPLMVMAAVNVPQLLVGLAVSRPSYIEDELAGRGGTPDPSPGAPLTHASGTGRSSSVEPSYRRDGACPGRMKPDS